ncbi:Redoxin [Halobiforma haloterrestris]|uniref:Redoxin n=1 Tax=Natronobacterium haloterrestre TaxID=148448 RepID=A0A1I1FAX7_NATHA|nr:TlpA disulfide reductase family protein [Halobiforma haloterrestris]SFB94303.1 Redoxin [Halobiforma haloterrestris]
MQRRDILAGLGSVGIIGGAGVAAVYGLPTGDDFGDGADGSTGDDGSDGGDGGDSYDSVEIETVDAPGSEAGTVLVPATDRPTFVDFFGTWCPPCKEQMPALAEAHERIGDEVLFISITSESVGEDGMVTEAELVEWWDEHGGQWTVGLDPAAQLSYRVTSYPTAMTIDTSGRIRWSDSGIKTADEIVSKIEAVLDLEDGGESDPDSEGTEDA